MQLWPLRVVMLTCVHASQINQLSVEFLKCAENLPGCFEACLACGIGACATVQQPPNNQRSDHAYDHADQSFHESRS